jgi:hypothetical protein
MAQSRIIIIAGIAAQLSQPRPVASNDPEPSPNGATSLHTGGTAAHLTGHGQWAGEANARTTVGARRYLRHPRLSEIQERRSLPNQFG